MGESGSQGETLPAKESQSRRSGWLPWAVAALCALGAIIFAVLSWMRPPDRAKVVRAYVRAMPESTFVFTGQMAGFALSPDGNKLVYVAQNANGRAFLWVRGLDSMQAQPLGGTEDATYPFWSPDSRTIGFFAAGKLKKIDAAGGPPLTLCDAPTARGGTWNQDGVILLAPNINSPIMRVSALGGAPAPVTILDAAKGAVTHRWPQFLPDGKHFLYLAGAFFGFQENTTNEIVIGSLDSKERKVVLNTHANAVYASGHILFLRRNTLMAQAFDTKRMELTGEAFPVADPVQDDDLTIRAVFSASQNGQLAYVEGASGSSRELIWVDRTGKRIGGVPGADAYSAPRVSPDGKSVLFTLSSPGFDVWRYDLDRGVKTRLTFGSTSGVASLYPAWSPDGSRIAYTSVRNGKFGFYEKAADGSGSESPFLENSTYVKYINDWSPDGKHLVFQDYQYGAAGVFALPLEGERKAFAVQQSPLFSMLRSALSPDGKWLAYCSNEAGDFRVYVVPFPGPGGKWQVSPGGGDFPRWGRDGKELYYLSLDNKVMAAEVKTTGASFAIGAVKPLFDVRAYRSVVNSFDVSPDGQRFYFVYEPGQPNAAIALVENWDAELRKK